MEMIEHFDHQLKSWPKMYRAFVSGQRLHDVRRSTDRKFSVGQIVKLVEFSPSEQMYTGNSCLAEITYITSAEVPCPFFGTAISEGFCVLSLRKLGEIG